jgi:hypothetical protein
MKALNQQISQLFTSGFPTTKQLNILVNDILTLQNSLYYYSDLLFRLVCSCSIQTFPYTHLPTLSGYYLSNFRTFYYRFSCFALLFNRLEYILSLLFCREMKFSESEVAMNIKMTAKYKITKYIV